MKPTIFLINLLIITKNILAQDIYNINGYNGYNEYNGYNNFANEECSYINELIGQEYSYNCCNHIGITCENNHITKMYIF